MRVAGVMKSMLVILAAIVAMAITSVAQQQDQPRPDQSQPAALSQSSDQQPTGDQAGQKGDQGQQMQGMQGMSPESELLSKMHMANQMEIKAGQLAESKGTTQSIRNFSALLARDYSYADKRIANLAKQQGIQLMQMRHAEVA